MVFLAAEMEFMAESLRVVGSGMDSRNAAMPLVNADGCGCCLLGGGPRR